MDFGVFISKFWSFHSIRPLTSFVPQDLLSYLENEDKFYCYTQAQYII